MIRVRTHVARSMPSVRRSDDVDSIIWRAEGSSRRSWMTATKMFHGYSWPWRRASASDLIKTCVILEPRKSLEWYMRSAEVSSCRNVIFCFAASESATQSAWLANAGSGKGCSVQKHWAADGSAPAGSCAVTAARYLLLTAVVLDAWYDTQSVVNAVSLAKTLRHVRLEHVFLETGEGRIFARSPFNSVFSRCLKPGHSLPRGFLNQTSSSYSSQMPLAVRTFGIAPSSCCARN